MASGWHRHPYHRRDADEDDIYGITTVMTIMFPVTLTVVTMISRTIVMTLTIAMISMILVME